MLSDNFFSNVMIVVLIQATLLFLYHLIINKNNKDNDILDEKINTIKAILESTKHDKILSLDKIKEYELDAKEVYIFSKNMFRDVKNSGQFAEDAYSIGTFYPTVKKNLLYSTIQYTYFLKKDSHWKHFIYSFSESYKEVKDINKKVNFFMIPAEKYYFYGEIYLYKEENGYRGFEFLPSISNEKEQVLYYLELEDNQLRRLVSIKDKLIDTYPNNKLSDLLCKN